ncbi:MAG TPA: hypothetical protein DCX14_09005 [Flavobacteriales bacterium]|jgi:hypothetical protein|nr:hypothetical protein [Flavobacteriales bacterium]
MIKKIIIALVLLGIVGGSAGYYMSQKGHDETADATAAFVSTSDDIVQEFLDDLPGSTTKYVDKVIEISGPVFEVMKTDGKITGVKISSDEFFIVSCTFQESPAEIPEGEVSVKGVVSGFNGDADSMLPGVTLELNRAVVVTK